MIARAEEHGNPAHLADAVSSLGFARMLSGDFALAIPDYERTLALLDSIAARLTHQRLKLIPSDMWMYLQNQGASRSLWAWNEWFVGYPDRALKQIKIATDFARESGSKAILASGHIFAATVHELRRELEPMRDRAQAVIDLGNSAFSPMSEISLGWADTHEGDLEGGIARMRHHLERQRSTGSEFGSVGALARIADALGRARRFDEGLQAIDEAFLIIERTGERMVEAEVHREKGELLLAQDASNAAPAEQSFRAAIAIARRQKARSWELRATTSLARMLAKQGKREEGRTMLAEIYNWFTEGFDTADLKDAGALLDELNE